MKSDINYLIDLNEFLSVGENSFRKVWDRQAANPIIAMKALIVDDEQQSHKVLQALLTQYFSHIELLPAAYSIAEGLETIRQHAPDLLFLDIELKDGLGFDLLKHFPQPDFQIIFISAHNHYAITAIGFGALKYLLKPISLEELRDAIEKAENKLDGKIRQEQLQIMLETFQKLQQQQLPSRMGISTSEGIHFKQVKDIIRLEAHQNYTQFTFANHSKKLLASTNIGEYATQFGPYREFMRVHRSHLINLHYVDTYVKADGGYLLLQDGSHVAVSRKYRDELLGRMGGL